MLIPSATKLYIIGNGFDLHHKIQSSYTDYRTWLESNDPETLADINEIFGMPELPWWRNFEESLTVFKRSFSTSVNAMTEASLVKELNIINPELLADIESYDTLSKPVLMRCFAQAKAVRLV